MTKFNTSIAIAVAALFLSGSAMAASLQPAAGNLPFASEPAVAGMLARSAVEAGAVAHVPAAGQNSAAALVGASDGMLSRSEVAAQASASQPAAGEQNPGYVRMSAASPVASWHFSALAGSASRMPAAGEFSDLQPAAIGSTLTRQTVEAQAALHGPVAGDL